MAMKAPKENTALVTFDRAQSEIQVIQQELQKYMIAVAFDTFETETNSLVKAFEMTNVKLAAFVNPQ